MDELTGERSYESATLLLSISKAIPERMRAATRELTSLHVPLEDRRQGYARQLMANVCMEADEAGKTLLVFVKPYGDIDLSKTQLRDWYSRMGFQVIQEQPCLMARMPGSSPSQLSPLTHAVGAAIESLH